MEKLYDNIKKHMEMLCLTCGPRQAGSKGSEMATKYIEDEFKKMGYETVLEGYPSIGWDCTKFSLYNVTKDEEVPCSTAAYFSPSVNIEDKIMWLKGGDLLNLDKLDLKGKLCFIEATKIEEGHNRYSEILDAYGAAGTIFFSTGNPTPNTKAPRSPFVEKMGVATVGPDGAFYLAKNKEDTYRFVVESKKFDHTSYNVIARHKGNGKRRGVVGAHFDTAPFIQGANDNASGTAVMMELARLMKDKLPEDISIDFCGFGVEEYITEVFPAGSGNYVERHKAEGIDWFLNIDTAGGILSDRILELSHTERLPKLEVKNAGYITDKVLTGDDKTFSLNDIPTVWLKGIATFGELHTFADNLDIISYDRMVEETKDYVDLMTQLLK